MAAEPVKNRRYRGQPRIRWAVGRLKETGTTEIDSEISWRLNRVRKKPVPGEHRSRCVGWLHTKRNVHGYKAVIKALDHSPKRPGSAGLSPRHMPVDFLSRRKCVDNYRAAQREKPSAGHPLTERRIILRENLTIMTIIQCTTSTPSGFPTPAPPDFVFSRARTAAACRPG